MPLSLTVGLSRKVSRDFQSTGVSISINAELDQALLARPGEFQAQIDGLYAQAASAIDRQVKMYAAETTPAPAEPPPAAHRNGFARLSGNGRQRTPRRLAGMTPSQRRAICAIAQRLGRDPDDEAHELLGAPLQALSIRQASDLIDFLKNQGIPQNGQDEAHR